MARLFAVKKPLPAAKEEIRRLAGTLTPAKRAGDFAQALMDLGASLCTPKRPSCLMCPLQRDCAAHDQGIEGTLPIKAVRTERPVRLGLAFLALREDGHVLLRRRPEAGLLGGMLEVPSAEWADTLPPVHEALRTAPVRADWWSVPGVVTHTFTHFKLETLVYRAIVPADASLTFWADPQRCRWVPRRDLDRAALPSVMRKIIAHGLKEQSDVTCLCGGGHPRHTAHAANIVRHACVRSPPARRMTVAPTLPAAWPRGSGWLARRAMRASSRRSTRRIGGGQKRALGVASATAAGANEARRRLAANSMSSLPADRSSRPT